MSVIVLIVFFSLFQTVDLYKGELKVKMVCESENMKKINPLDSLDFESDEFRKCVNQLANHLKIPVHLDNLTTLKAILIYIHNKLNSQADETESKSSIFKLDDIPLGFDVDNKDLKDGLKLLRLLYINKLRDLQTNINQIIAQTQSITANPITDSTLGKVGR